MIYYNVTSQLDKSIENEWVKWMQEEYIPEVLRMKYFIEIKLLKLNLKEQQDSCSYATQYLLFSETFLYNYINNKADYLRNKTIERFGEKVLSFSTQLELISEHK